MSRNQLMHVSLQFFSKNPKSDCTVGINIIFVKRKCTLTVDLITEETEIIHLLRDLE